MSLVFDQLSNRTATHTPDCPDCFAPVEIKQEMGCEVRNWATNRPITKRQKIVVHIFMIYAPEMNRTIFQYRRLPFVLVWLPLLAHFRLSPIRNDYFPLDLFPMSKGSSPVILVAIK